MSEGEVLTPEFLQRLARLEFRVRQLMGGLRRGDHSVNRRGSGSLFLEHRAYTPGDDPRFLDWNAYLRLGELVVKEYQAEISPRVLLVLDRSASMATGSSDRALYARRLAATLGVIALGRQANVVLATVPASGGRRHFQGGTARRAFLSAIEALDCEGPSSFLEATRPALHGWRRGGFAFVISDFLQDAPALSLLRLLAAEKYQTTALSLWSSGDYRVAVGSRIELVDAETGRRRRERIGPALASAYRRELTRHFERLQIKCRGLGVDYRRLDVTQSLEESLLALVRSGVLVA